MTTTIEALNRLSEYIVSTHRPRSAASARTYTKQFEQSANGGSGQMLDILTEQLFLAAVNKERNKQVIVNQAHKLHLAFLAILKFDSDRPLMSDRNFAEGMIRRLQMLVKEGEEYFELPTEGFWGEVVTELGEVGEAEYKLQEVADLIIFAIQAMILEFLGKHSANTDQFNVSVYDMESVEYELATKCVLWAREQEIIIPGKRKKVRYARLAYSKHYRELSEQLEKIFKQLNDNLLQVGGEEEMFQQEYIRKSLLTIIELGVKICWSLGMDWSQATQEKLIRNAIRYPAGLFQTPSPSSTLIQTYMEISRYCKAAHGENRLPTESEIEHISDEQLAALKSQEGGTREFYNDLLALIDLKKRRKNS